MNYLLCLYVVYKEKIKYGTNIIKNQQKKKVKV